MKLCHLMALSVYDIIWFWWQINKWLRYIGRLILAADSWSTDTDLSHCHSTAIHTREADHGMNPGLLARRLWPNSFLSLLFWFWLILWLYWRITTVPDTHNLIQKINTTVGLPLAQLFSVHSLWMHSCHSALYYRSHTALRNWLLCLRCTY
jgi:hypothetical protein